MINKNNSNSKHRIICLSLLFITCFFNNTIAQSLYFQDFNSGADGWVTGSLQGSRSSTWTVQARSNINGSKNFGTPNNGSLGFENSFIQSPGIIINNTIATIEFDSYNNNEPGFPSSYDVEWVEYSLNNGSSWTAMHGSVPNLHFSTGKKHFSFSQTIPFGSSVKFRFRYNTGDACCGPNDGWYIDNVSVNGSSNNQDITPPIAKAKNLTVQLNVNGNAVITPQQINNGSTDNVGIVSYALDKTSFNCNNLGNNLVKLTVTDASGNSSFATATVTVVDVTKPIVPVLADVKGQCSATATAPTTTDNCAGTITGTTTDAITYTTQGTNVITWSFNDGNGNVSTATQNVIVKDDIAPVVPVLADVKGQCSETVTAPSTTDNCAGTVTGTTTDALTYTTQGTHVITWSFDDGNGNVSTATQNVIVKDDINPVVPVLADIKGQCAATASTPTTTDNCSGSITGTTTNPLTYSTQGTHVITWSFNDGNGNVSTATQNVIVKDDIKPTVLTQNISVDLVNGSATITAAQINNGSSDNCGIASVVLDRTTFDCSSIGANTVTLTVTDVNGNPSTATAVVTVVGEKTTSSITSVPNSGVYTGGVSTNLFLGYGAQSTTLQVTNVASGGTDPRSYTYQWSGVASSSLSSTTSGSPVFTPTAAGLYNFTVTVTNKYGCTSTASISICVKDVREKDKNGKFTGKVYLTHYPSNDPTKGNTISISVNAVPSHLSQHSLDRLGVLSDVPCTSSTSPLTTYAVGGSSSENKVSISDLNVNSTEFIAYPNPFGKVTTVRFTLPYQEDKATLDIYDLKGVKIQTLFNGNANAQTTYEVQFNGQNLSAGTYFFRLITAKEVKNFKVIMSE